MKRDKFVQDGFRIYKLYAYNIQVPKYENSVS